MTDRNIQGRATDYESNWACANGHTSETYLILHRDGDNIRILGGSSWDLCDACGESPPAREAVRMRLDILRQWADAGIITPEEHEKLAETMGDEAHVRSWAERIEGALAGGAPANTVETGGIPGCAYPGCPEQSTENWYRKDQRPPHEMRWTPLCGQHDAMVPRDDREAKRWLAALVDSPTP